MNEANEIYLDKSISDNIIEKGMSGILNALYDANDKDHMPLSVFMELTSACNFNCPFCYINEKGHKSSFLPRWRVLK